MKNEETGEFELVLGNRQLLSGFFVVVVLFAVFFVMGYFVGRNSAPPVRVAASNPPAGTVAPASENRPPAASPAVPSPAPAVPQPATQAPAGEPQPTTQPVRETEAPGEPPAPAAAAPPAEPAAGQTYLQVMAVRQEEAAIVARTLKDQGFPSSLAPAPKGLTRVLVGPYSDTASLGKAKAELENAGFHPIVKK
jgi:cell division protein FtsN